MAMGIDQEIQRRMDAYRGNPQALQQRYQMSQQLLDLLALQKLKSEKDAMARQMQAQMQQMPGTVAQQMEQEMVGRAKNELLQQVGGTMRTQAARQQQNAARMAQAMARPQAGIAGLAPQTARMAGGGIVAFAQGGMNDPMARLDAQLEALQTELKSLGPYSTFGVVPAGSEEKYARIGELESQIQDLERRRPLLERMIAGEPLPSTRTGLSLPGARGRREEDVAALQEFMAPVAATAATTPTAPAPAPAPAPAGSPGDGKGPLLDAPPYLPTGRSTATEALRSVGRAGEESEATKITQRPEEPTYTRAEAPGITLAEPAGLDTLRTNVKGLMEGEAPTEEALLKKYSGILGLDKLREQREGRLAELAALDKAQLDPEKLRQERVLRKFAAAGAGRSMAQTQADVMLEQEKRERDRLVQRQKIADEIDAAELGMNKDLLTQSLRTVEGAKNMKIKGMEMLRNLGRDEFDRAKAQAEVQWNQYKEENAERFREYTALADAANRALRAAQVDESALSRLITEIGTLYGEERKAQRALLEQDQQYLDLISNEERTPEEEAQLRKMISTADAEALLLVDKANLLGLQDDLAARLLERLGMARTAR